MKKKNQNFHPLCPDAVATSVRAKATSVRTFLYCRSSWSLKQNMSHKNAGLYPKCFLFSLVDSSSMLAMLHP